MNDPLNPYAPPKSIIEPARLDSLGRCWRKGNLLFMEQGAALPCRCVKCNAPVTTPIKARKIYWHAPGWFLLILVNLLIYAIVALAIRKKATIAPGLCPKHASRRNAWMAFGWLGSLGGLFLGMWGLISQHGDFIGIGFLLFFVALIAGLIGARIVTPTRIDPQLITLKGCGREFLDSLPSA
jgi:hypothetical protein